MANTLVWEPVGMGGAAGRQGRPQGRVQSTRARSVTGRAAASRSVTPRQHQAQRIGWQRLVSGLADILMVVLWAAMIPGLMWVGAAAGF